MNKKNHVLIFFIILLFAGCKYEEGPGISFRTARNRVIGEWEVESLTVDGADSLADFKNRNGYCAMYDFRDNGTDYLFIGFLCDSLTVPNSGYWSLGVDNKTISMSSFYRYGPVFNGNVQWEIIRLANKEMWLRTQYFNYKTYEIHFKAS